MKKVSDLIPLFPSQKWILKNINPPNHWNISYMLFSEKRYDEKKIVKVINKIVDIHEIFKVRFIKKDNEYYQKFEKNKNNHYHFMFKEIPAEKGKKDIIFRYMKETQKKINIFDGPLFSIGLFREPEGDHLYLVVHHLISDAYSFKLLVFDLIKGYTKLINNQELKIRQSDSFYNAVDQLYNFTKTEHIKKEINYWNKIINVKTKPLPCHKKINKDQKIEKNCCDIHNIVLQKDEYNDMKIKLESLKINDYLFYIYIIGISLCEWKNDINVFVTLVNHGRNWTLGNLNLRKTLGPFWINYPVVLKSKTKNDVIIETEILKEKLNGIPNNGRGFEILKEITHKTKIKNKTIKNNIPNILFNYYGTMNENHIINKDFGVMSPFFRDFNRHENAYCDFTLIFNLREIDNTLRLQLIFNKIEFELENINKLFKIYEKNIKKSINRLINKRCLVTK